MLYGDGEQTLRPDEALSPTALRDTLEEMDVPVLNTNGALRLANATIAWNVFQHFYPYFEVVDTDWDEVLTRSLRHALEDESKREFLQTLPSTTARNTTSSASSRTCGPSGRSRAYRPDETRCCRRGSRCSGRSDPGEGAPPRVSQGDLNRFTESPDEARIPVAEARPETFRLNCPPVPLLQESGTGVFLDRHSTATASWHEAQWCPDPGQYIHAPTRPLAHDIQAVSLIRGVRASTPQRKFLTYDRPDRHGWALTISDLTSLL